MREEKRRGALIRLDWICAEVMLLLLANVECKTRELVWSLEPQMLLKWPLSSGFVSIATGAR